VNYLVLLVTFLTLTTTTYAATPNIVFILADDLGVNDLACYGRKEHHTPHLDQLAKDGLRFTNAYAACPVCSPTRAATMTGKYPARLHLTTFLPGRGDAPSQKLLHPTIRQQLPLDEVTLAEQLKTRGYATACIGKWHLGGPNFSPKKQGFEVAFEGKGNTPPSDTEGGKNEYELTQKATDFITANKDKPFFLYFCHHTPHIPLGAKKELIEKYKDTYNPVYAAMIHEMDASVGRVLAKLDELKLRENTIVVFTSDNGGLHVPELKDDPPTHNMPYRAGKGFLYEGGIRVPAIVRWPGRMEKGEQHQPISSIDWTPTFLEAVGIEAKSLDGQSIFPASPNRDLYWHIPHYTNQGSRPSGAIRSGNWKLIEHYEDSSVELFDLMKDASEENDLAKQQPEKAKELLTKLQNWRTSVNAQMNTPNPNFDAAKHKALYLDTDVSKLKPKKTAAETTTAYRDWRTMVDAAVRKMAP
jgi:arylsulfatase A